MNIEKMTDEEVLANFVEMLETRVSITTGFAKETPEGNLTHQFIQVKCGEFEVTSHPEALEIPLRTVTASESGQTVN